MNIVVSHSNSGGYYFRPDNTLVRGSGPFYLPDTISNIEIAPAIAVRIDRAAKGLSRQFVRRYLSVYTYGLLIYAHAKKEVIDADLSTQTATLSVLWRTPSLKEILSTTLDNTTYISENFLPIESITEEPEISLTIDNQSYSYKIAPTLKESIYELIEKTTNHSSLKTGDLIFMELGDKRRAEPGSSILLSSPDIGIMAIDIK